MVDQNIESIGSISGSFDTTRPRRVLQAEERKLVRLREREERNVAKLRKREERGLARLRERDPKQALRNQQDEQRRRDRQARDESAAQAHLRYEARKAQEEEERRALAIQERTRKAREAEERKLTKLREKERKQALRDEQDEQRCRDRQARDEAAMQAHLHHKAVAEARKAQDAENYRLRDEQRRATVVGGQCILSECSLVRPYGRSVFLSARDFIIIACSVSKSMRYIFTPTIILYNTF